MSQWEKDARQRIIDSSPTTGYIRQITDNSIDQAFQIHRRDTVRQVAEKVFIAICGSQAVEVNDYAEAAKRSFELAETFVLRMERDIV